MKSLKSLSCWKPPAQESTVTVQGYPLEQAHGSGTHTAQRGREGGKEAAFLGESDIYPELFNKNQLKQGKSCPKSSHERAWLRIPVIIPGIY